MNDWNLDFMVARGRMAERLSRAEHSLQARAQAERRPPLRLKVHLDVQVSFGRESAAAAASEPAA